MIKSTNKRIMITLPKEIFDKISILSKNDNRSISNFILFIISKYLKDEL